MNRDHAAEEAINETLSDWATALRNADLDTIATLVTEDAEFWSHGEPPLNGPVALKQAFEPFFTQYKMHQDFHCQELIVCGEYAFMRGLEVNRLVSHDGGEVMEVKQRAFSVLRYGSDGRWRFSRGMTNLPPDGEEPSSGQESASFAR